MKNFRLLFLLMAISMAFVSCEKDEADSVSGNKYETTYAKVTAVKTGTANVTVEYKTKADLEEEYLYWILEFKADGKFYVDAELSGTWSQSGATVTVADEDGEKTSLSVDGSDLSMSETDTEEGVTSTLFMRFSKK
jgi:YD repeat-containing protein